MPSVPNEIPQHQILGTPSNLKTHAMFISSRKHLLEAESKGFVFESVVNVLNLYREESFSFMFSVVIAVRLMYSLMISGHQLTQTEALRP